MAHPRISFQRLSDMADRLPPDGDLLGQAERDEVDPRNAWVAWVHGSASLPTLDLDAPFAAGRPLRAWVEGGAPASNAPFALVFEGDLDVARDLSSMLDADSALPHLVVLGDLRAADIVVGGQSLHVSGRLEVRDLFWGDQDAGGLQVGGDFAAKVVLLTQGYSLAVGGTQHCDCMLDEASPGRDGPFNVLRHSHEALAFVFEADAFAGIGDGLRSAADTLDRDAVVQAVREGRPILKLVLGLDAAMPRADDLFPDAAITVRNIERLLQAPGIMAPDAHTSDACWWSRVQFSLTRRHMDADGDQRHDHVYATVHKAWDFYLGLAHTPVAGRLSRMLGSVLRGSRPAESKSLQLVYRRYGDDGEPGEWEILTPEAEDGEPWESCQMVWLGVLDYARKAAGQVRAGHPLQALLREQFTAGRLEAIAGLALFRQQYNEWEGGDHMGYWEDDVFIAVRQPGDYGDATSEGGVGLKFNYEIDAVHPGDEEHRNHCSYLVELAGGAAGASAAVPNVSYVQRQGDTYETMPLHAVDHRARLLRFFNTMQAPMLGRNAICLDRLADTARTEAAARLLQTPPLAEDLPDEAIFPAPLLALSQRWQHDGAARVALVRSYQRRADAGEVSEAEREQALPDDLRTADAALVLELARNVSRCADADLHRRLRRLFSFAPDAMEDHAAEHGQEIGPVFWLGPQRAVLRVGGPADAGRHWLEVDGFSQRPLPLLHGLGRSLDRGCFARSDGRCVTTHFGWDDAEVMRFALPAAPTEVALPCEELLPFHDGQRVLLRNATGIYLLCAEGVRRLYPLRADPTPQRADANADPQDEADGTELPMLHMALSPDERQLAVGCQISDHCLLDLDGPATGRLSRTIGAASEYPHHAVFSANGQTVFLNACHYYKGVTLRLPLAGGATTEPSELDYGWRVYASAATPEHVLMGCAKGYVHAVDDTGARRWRHHISGTVSAIDTAPDGTELLVGSHGGYLACLVYRPDSPDPYSIGDSPYTETHRWILPNDGAAPICW